MVDLIEFVCTANIGRSKPSEFIANAYLQEIGEDHLLHAISSGSNAMEIETGRVPEALKIRFIQAGIDRDDIYTPAQLSQFNEAVEKGDSQAIDGLYMIVEEKFHHEEVANRAAAMSYFGIEGRLNVRGTQTFAVPNRAVVLPMAESNKKAVEGIYDRAGFRPPLGIELLGAYATGNPDAQVPDAFGKGRDVYFKTIETLLDYVPKAVEKALR